MRVLVTWGSKMGGTAGIGQIIAQTLEGHGHDVTAAAAKEVRDLAPYDAVVAGGALYANRWHADARGFIARHRKALGRVPVWFFSSGPLDDSAERADLPPPARVLALMERIGALGHVTFGGRLSSDAKGFPAAAMAKEHAGDWRNPERIRRWADELARALPTARPAPAMTPPGHSLARLFAYAAAGWVLCAATMGGLLQLGSTRLAITLHAILAPLYFVVLSFFYFRPRGARAALPTALAFTGFAAVTDAVVVAGLIQRSPALFTHVTGFWLPLALIFLVTWATGAIASMMPFPQPPPKSPPLTPAREGA